jgi:Probable cobalt transporter subunit (CbtA)
MPLNGRTMPPAPGFIARDFLIRGLLVGLFAGIVAFGVAYVIGEPSVNASIAIEESGAHSHEDTTMPAEHETVVPRSLQSTVGLLTGTAVAGTTIGGLVGVLSALAMGRFGGLGPRATTMVIAGFGFVSVYLVPFAAYPANPPAVGHSDTIGYRTGLYFSMMAISLIAAITAILVGRRLAGRLGAWRATLAATGGFLVVVIVAIVLMPGYNEVPADFPATVLYNFRMASLLTQLTLWTVLGVGLAEAIHRMSRRAGSPIARELAASGV